MKVLFVVSECMPFIATGGLAEVAGSLPKELKKQGVNIKVIMPLYKKMIEKYQNELIYVGSTTVQLAWRNLYCGLFKMKYDGIDYYFVDNQYYFNRDQIYGHYDDGERFAFFSKSIFDCMNLMKFYPNIIHCHDHQTALVTVYLDLLKKKGTLMDIKSVFTIHNIEYQGRYDYKFLTDVLGIDERYCSILEYKDCINVMKGAIVCSDLVTTVSPRYAREISTARYAFGLEHIINMNRQKIIGILNGINYSFYNSKTDEEIVKNYDFKTIELKKENKRALQKSFNLNRDDEACLISIISRLVTHKGIDLVVDKLDEMMQSNIQLIILGVGESYYEEKFKYFTSKYPGKVYYIKAFNTALSKQIYSGSDLFLMPSKSEPCGLSQMIACRYCTVPIVHATGGLFDSINDENGFVFKNDDATEMLWKIQEAVWIYKNKEQFMEKIKNAYNTDFSWKKSAKVYFNEYTKLTSGD